MPVNLLKPCWLGRCPDKKLEEFGEDGVRHLRRWAYSAWWWWSRDLAIWTYCSGTTV